MSTENKKAREFWVEDRGYGEKIVRTKPPLSYYTEDNPDYVFIHVHEVLPETDGVWVSKAQWSELWDEVLSQHWGNLEGLLTRIEKAGGK